MSQISKGNEKCSVWLLPKAVASPNLITSISGWDLGCDWKCGKPEILIRVLELPSVTWYDQVVQLEGRDRNTEESQLSCPLSYASSSHLVTPVPLSEFLVFCISNHNQKPGLK